MSRIFLIQPGNALRDRLKTTLGNHPRIVLEILDSPEEAIGALAKDPASVPAIIIGDACECPIRLAQKIQLAGRTIPIFACTDGAHAERMRTVFTESPFIADTCIVHPAWDLDALATLIDNLTSSEELDNGAPMRCRWHGSIQQTLGMFDHLLDHATVGFAVLDAKEHVVAFSPLVNEMLGRSDLELGGSTTGEIFGNEDATLLRTHIERHSGDEHATQLLRYERTDGIRWIEINSVRMPGRHQSPLVLLIMRDITRRKEAQDALAKANQTLEARVRQRTEELSRERALLQNLMDYLPDKIFFKDRDSRFIRVNAAHARQLGHASPDDSVGKTDFDLFSRDTAQEARDAELHIMESGEPIVDHETQERLADGTLRYIAVTKVPLRDEHNAIVGTFGIVRDITRRKTAEIKARTTTHLLQSIIDNIPSQIAFKDVQGRYMLNNRAHLNYLGVRERGDVLGRTLADIRPGPSALASVADDLRMLANGHQEINREEFDPSIGENGAWLLTSKIPLRDDNGTTTGILAIRTDFTKQKQAESDLREKNRQIEEDLVLAHKFQLALLPQSYPSMPIGTPEINSCLSFAHYYQPSSNLAGDFFYFIPVSETRLGVLVCDVMGHGVRAALFTAILRGLVEKLRDHAVDPADFLSELNRGVRSIVQKARTKIFVTATYLVIDIGIRRMRWASAGHPLPLRFQAADGSVTALPEDPVAGPEPALGFLDDFRYTGSMGGFEENDVFLFYTDGLTEAINRRTMGAFGEARLRDAFNAYAALPEAEIVNRIVEDARIHTERHEFDDDLCLLTMRIKRLQ